jgi:hypothetical protein
MENEKTFLEPLLDRAEAFGKTSYELVRLKTVEKTTNVVSTISSRAIALYIISFSVFMASIGAALWLGDILGKTYYGFLCVAGFYAIVGGIFYFFLHNWMKKCVGDSVVKQILN